MRPPSHMPLPAMMIAPLCRRLMCCDCSAVLLSVRLGSRAHAVQPLAQATRFLAS